MQSLLEYGPRYQEVLRTSAAKFKAPVRLTEIQVVERLTGGAGTNQGWPQAYPADDAAEMNSQEVKRAVEILTACWTTMDRAVRAAKGKSLGQPVSGRGRNLEGMLRHVLHGHTLYLTELGARIDPRTAPTVESRLREVRRLTPGLLREAVSRHRLSVGTRLRKGWTPRYFVRRAAWHILDHAWELEDRAG